MQMPGERRELTFSATCRGATHFCSFLRDERGFSRRDRSALEGWAESNEFCIFVISDQLTESEACIALRRAILILTDM